MEQMYMWQAPEDEFRGFPSAFEVRDLVSKLSELKETPGMEREAHALEEKILGLVPVGLEVDGYPDDIGLRRARCITGSTRRETPTHTNAYTFMIVVFEIGEGGKTIRERKFSLIEFLSNIIRADAFDRQFEHPRFKLVCRATVAGLQPKRRLQLS